MKNFIEPVSIKGKKILWLLYKMDSWKKLLRNYHWETHGHFISPLSQTHVSMLDFYMLCSKDKEQKHEGTSMNLHWQIYLSPLKMLNYFSFLLKKYKTFLNVMNHVVQNHVNWWRDTIIAKEQVINRILFFCFHVMKAWIQNCLTCIPL
jgi:hypothetical protein